MRRFVGALALVVIWALPAEAQPAGISADCLSPWQRYAAAPGPKAFAAGLHQGCGWQVRTRALPDMASIRAQAVRQCAERAGANAGCRIVNQSR